jgi:anti-sigma-K factor RskA
MDADSFDVLALRALSREASDEERRELETRMIADPALREKFRQLKITYEIVRTVAPLSEAGQVREPGLPAWRVNELRTAVRRHFGSASTRRNRFDAATTLPAAWRWLCAGGGIAALAAIITLLAISDRFVEVGFYRADAVRGGEAVLTAQDVPRAKIVTFDQDASFDQWQHSLAWYQHGKVWIDNESNQLHIVRRDSHGQIVEENQPLAPTASGQREQINRAIDSLDRK